MNFNLASPSNNGNDFTIQFKEQLSIPANSKVKLNFAELVRDKEVILDEDATIKMEIAAADMIPTAPPAAPNADNLAFDTQTSSSKNATITKGDYTFIQFRDAVEVALINLLAFSNLKSYEVYVDNNENEAVLTIGIMPKTTETTALKAFEFDTTHEHDGTTDAGIYAYSTANVANAYDNYALADTHYYHYIDNATLGVTKTKEENQDITSKNNAYLYARSIQTIAAQTGNLWIGLYSKEYADGIGGAPPARITGNNPPQLSATGAHPCTFVGIECHKTDGINIFYAEDNAGNLITKWDDINRAIVDMKVVARIPPTQFEQTTNWDILVGTEIDNTKDTPSIRIKVANYQDGIFNLLWDSQPVNKNLPFKLMVGDVTTYDNATALNSQIPFNWLSSVKTTAIDNGFIDLEYKEFNKALGSNANPVSLAKKITLTLSTNAARTVGLRESLVIRPNQFTEANKNAIIADLNYTWKKNNYSILLDLPLNNFKNKQAPARNADGASVSKQVLANIPAAFSTGETTEAIQDALGNSEIITVYQPYNVIESRLKNNPIEINQMNFRIVDMLTEELAKEIKRSIINFTIEPPEKM